MADGGDTEQAVGTKLEEKITSDFAECNITTGGEKLVEDFTNAEFFGDFKFKTEVYTSGGYIVRLTEPRQFVSREGIRSEGSVIVCLQGGTITMEGFTGALKIFDQLFNTVSPSDTTVKQIIHAFYIAPEGTDLVLTETAAKEGAQTLIDKVRSGAANINNLLRAVRQDGITTLSSLNLVGGAMCISARSKILKLVAAGLGTTFKVQHVDSAQDAINYMKAVSGWDMLYTPPAPPLEKEEQQPATEGGKRSEM